MAFSWSDVSGTQGPTFDADLGVKFGGVALTADGALDEWVDQSPFALDTHITATPSVITWTKLGLNGHGTVNFNPGGDASDPLHKNNLKTVDATNAGVGHLGDPTTRTKFTWYLVFQSEVLNPTTNHEAILTELRYDPSIALYQLGVQNFAGMYPLTQPSIEVAFTTSLVAPFGTTFVFPFSSVFAWHLVTVRFDGTQIATDQDEQDRLRMKLYVDNVERLPTYVLTAGPNAKHCSANTGDASTAAITSYNMGTTRGGHDAWKGKLAFSRIQYDAAHTDVERTLVWGYLQDRYLLGGAPSAPSGCSAELSGVD